MHTRHPLTAFVLLAGFAACGTSNQTSDTPSGSDDSGAAGGSSGGSGGSGGTSGGASGSSGASGSTSSSGGAGDSASASQEGGGAPDGGYGSSGDGGSCTSALSGRVRVTEIDVGVAVSYNEVDTPLTPLAISAITGGGSRVGFMSTDGHAHVVTLDAEDQVVAGSAFGVAASDFQDLYADTNGGVMLVSRAVGGRGNPQLRHAREPVRHPAQPRDPVLRHVHGALRRHRRDLGDQAHAVERVAPART